MKFEVLYTDHFERELKRLAKKHGSVKNDLADLIETLENDPIQGTPIGKSCYKIRLAIKSKGKGKSGGARVITHIFIEGKTVYLLSIFDKSEQDSLTDKELEAMLKLIR